MKRTILTARLIALVTVLALLGVLHRPAFGSGEGLSDGRPYPVPKVPRPALRKAMTDPVFGTTITRITDPSMVPPASGKPVKGLRLEYSRYPAVNANNTLMAVLVLGGAQGGQHQIREIATGKHVDTIPRDGYDTEVSWHPTNPNLLFYRCGSQIRQFRTDTGKVEVLMQFPEYASIRTREEGRPSDDWRYYAFIGYPRAGGKVDLVVADLVQKKVVARWRQVAATPDWVGMSPSGQYVVAQFTNGWGTRLYRRDNFTYVRMLDPDYTHSDFAIDANGNEVLVYYAVTSKEVAEFGGRAGLVSVRLSDGKKTFLHENHFWWSVHVSGIGSRANRGWVLISTYNSPSAPQRPQGREIFWLKLDGSGGNCRIAHHHSDPATSGSNKDYWAEPHAVASWDGKRVYFSSCWEQSFTRYDFYQVTGNFRLPR